MTSSEFSEWKAYYRLETFGSLEDDIRIGRLASAIINEMRRYLGGPRTRVADFVPKLQQSTKQSVEQMKMICQALAEAAKMEKDRKFRRRRR